MQIETLGIIGLGLIGSSLARDARAEGFAARLLGADVEPKHARKALELGIVDAVLPFEAVVAEADLILLAAPVDHLLRLLPETLDKIHPNQTVIDVGSTKEPLLQAVARHPMRRRYVAAHPMAGTEKQGPEASFNGLFRNHAVILVDPEGSDTDAVALATIFFQTIGANLVELDAQTHDRTIALLSHLPHLLSYALARTIENETGNTGEKTPLAGGGLASMLRLSKSPASMWLPILLQNRSAILDALAAYERELLYFRKALEVNDSNALKELLKNHPTK